jgi:hypothetical protein
MSSTKRTPAHPAYNLPDTAVAAAAAATEAAEAATTAAAAATTAVAAATTAAEVASGFGGEVAEAVEAVEAGTVGYGPDLAGFGLANESGSESKNIQHALELRSSSREASGAAPLATLTGPEQCDH